MNVSELWSLTEWIEHEVKGAQVVEKYEAIRDVLRSNAQGQAQEPFESEKNDLIEVVRSVNVHAVTEEQLELLDRLGIGPYVGEQAVAHIEDVLYRNALDVATAANEMDEAVKRINDGLRRSDQVRDGVGGILPEEEPLSGVVVLRATFAGDASINNIVDLKNWATRWHEIGRGLTWAVGGAPEEFRVISAGRASLVIEFGLPIVLGPMVAGILLGALKVTEKVVTILNSVADLRNKKLLNKKLLLEIEKGARETEQAGASEISAEIIQTVGLKRDAEGDRVAALERSVTDLLDFLKRGGEVDLLLPEPEEEEPSEKEDHEESDATRQLRELRASVEDIRRLEARVRLLEAGAVEEAS